MAEAKNKQLKVLMTADTIGGVWTYCIELCRALQEYNVHFYVVTMGASLKTGQQKEAVALNNVTIYETDYLLEWMENPWQDIEESGALLLQLEKQFEPDIIHLNGYCHGALPFKAPILIIAHSDVWSWWLSVHKENPPAEWNEYYKRLKKGLASAQLITAPSGAMLRFIKEIYKPDVPCKVIYNARNSHVFKPALKQNYVMSMGRIWDEAKNSKLLVEAAATIDAPIKIAGEKKLKTNKLNTEAQNVIFLGHLNEEELAAQLAAAPVYCLPALYEPFGLSVLEAALSGCALVLGDIASLREIWQDNAMYVDPTNAIALADTINKLIKNEAVRAQYAKKAFMHAQTFSTQLMAQQYQQVYQSIVPKTALSKTEAA